MNMFWNIVPFIGLPPPAQLNLALNEPLFKESSNSLAYSARQETGFLQA